ncbi:MAG: alpha-1,2-fucosyltransferase [Lentisphaeria bacterium]|nr:alpha-1,2-fucosyltransferase [Lentisphaeria bacterium]
MKIVKIIGGLGNQMFQYALVLALKERFPDEVVKVDTTLFCNYRRHNGLELERIFGIALDTASAAEINQVSRCFTNYFLQRLWRKIFGCGRHEIVQRHDGEFLPDVFQAGKDLYYEGYWQNQDYFSEIADRVRSVYRFPDFTDDRNREAYRDITEAGNSVCIHVRRGDYLASPMYRGICDEHYYAEAVKMICRRYEAPRFYIFSDDQDWCRSFFPTLCSPNGDITFVDWNSGQNSFRDMQLMSAAACMVIANSSFSWWAAWLNARPGKVVIAPRRWLNNAPENDRQLPSWELV